LKVRAERGQLRGAAHAARADNRSGVKLTQRWATGDERIARVFTLKVRGKSQSRNGFGRQVLQAMEGHVDSLIEQRLLDLAYKRAQNFSIALIAACLDRNDFDLGIGIAVLKLRLKGIGLCQR
jgi:hypothetical protein